MGFENFKVTKDNDIETLTYLFTRDISVEAMEYGTIEPVARVADFINEFKSKFIVKDLNKRDSTLLYDYLDADIYEMIGKVLFLIKEEKIGVSKVTQEKHILGLIEIIEGNYKFEYDEINDMYFINQLHIINPHKSILRELSNYYIDMANQNLDKTPEWIKANDSIKKQEEKFKKIANNLSSR